MKLMKRLANGTATFVLLLVVGSTTMAPEAQARLVRGQPPSYYQKGLSSTEFLLEGGLAEPMGDQADPLYLVSEDPMANVKGLGQGTGYELGFRIRQYLSDYFAVSPAFHYIRMGSASGVMDYDGSQNLAYDIRSSTYKYGLDFHAFMGGPRSSFRPFLTGGIALAHNVYRDELQYKGIYKTSVNAPAYSGGLGFKMNNIELVGEYTYNRFESSNLPPDDGLRTYNWDFFVVRLGFSFGR
jgi:hypothetical protein